MVLWWTRPFKKLWSLRLPEDEQLCVEEMNVVRTRYYCYISTLGIYNNILMQYYSSFSCLNCLKGYVQTLYIVYTYIVFTHYNLYVLFILLQVINYYYSVYYTCVSTYLHRDVTQWLRELFNNNIYVYLQWSYF